MAGNIASLSTDDALLQDDIGARGKKPNPFAKGSKGGKAAAKKKGKKKKKKAKAPAARPPVSAIRQAMAPAAPAGMSGVNC